jgi:hypothetical protein
MAAPNSSAVSVALLGVLLNDPTLQALAPDGVWWDFAGEDAERFVLVSSVDEQDVPVFGGRGWENHLFFVKAVMLNAVAGEIASAADRIDKLLDDQLLEIPGYSFMAMFRDGQFRRNVERDEENAAIRWLHRGAYYRVHVALLADEHRSIGQNRSR